MKRLEILKQFFLEHKYWVIVGGVILGLLLGIGAYFIYQNCNKVDRKIVIEDVTKAEDDFIKQEQEEEELCQITVDIKGEVKVPGLYQLDCDSRVQDVINLAGGTTWKADTSVLNLSRKVIDEMVIIVYSKEQVADFVTTKQEETEKQQACPNQVEVKNDACIKAEDVLEEPTVDSEVIGDTPVKVLISLNKASKEELMTLSGIGEGKAKSIILYREEHGGFQSIEEIKNVKGIGDSIFEKIKDNITV